MSTNIDKESGATDGGRRSALKMIAAVAALLAPSAAVSAAGLSDAPGPPSSEVPPASLLGVLASRLRAAPRRRAFASVPFVVTERSDWDHGAAEAILAYRGPSQMWEFTDIAGPTLGLMREALNNQVFAFRNTDFLEVAATHGGAHLGMFNQATWDKYGLASLTGGAMKANTCIVEKPGVSPSDALQNLEGFYGPNNNNIISLQRRGAVFLACHDSIHALARTLAAKAGAPAPVDVIAADLTNNVIPGAVLVPSVVGFMVELQRSSFTYAKG